MMYDIGPCTSCGGGQPGGLRSFILIDDGRPLPVCDECYAANRQPRESLATKIGALFRQAYLDFVCRVRRIGL